MEPKFCKVCNKPGIVFIRRRPTITGKPSWTIPYCKEHWAVTSKRVLPEKYKNKAGYVMVIVDGRRIPEHRAVMEQKLGRKLVQGENVHHINGVRHDNTVSNLELWVNPQPSGVRASSLVCPHCRKAWA